MADRPWRGYRGTFFGHGGPFFPWPSFRGPWPSSMANDPKDRNAPKSEGKTDSKMPAVDTVTEKMDTEIVVYY